MPIPDARENRLFELSQGRRPATVGEPIGLESVANPMFLVSRCGELESSGSLNRKRIRRIPGARPQLDQGRDSREQGERGERSEPTNWTRLASFFRIDLRG